MGIPFIAGFGVVTLLFVIVNGLSYISERSAYYKFLEESGWDWAGAWSWGTPFKMVMAGLGYDNHSILMPSGFVLNIFTWIILSGVVGICCEVLMERMRITEE